MHFYELKIFTDLKAPIHFQKAPEAISKMIATILIWGGYKEHYETFPKNYVFSNLGKAESDGFFRRKGEIIFRTFREDVVQRMLAILFSYEDNIFRVTNARFREVPFTPIGSIVTTNPVFAKIETPKGERFWTLKESNGDLTSLLEILQRNLIKKYEIIFGEKLKPSTPFFVDKVQLKNRTPQTFYFKGIKLFGNKLYLVPHTDPVSQKLAFVAVGSGLGHKNSTIGGGFLKWFPLKGEKRGKMENRKRSFQKRGKGSGEGLSPKKGE
jgi:CRISPR-associated endoribonuclease Cas6